MSVAGLKVERILGATWRFTWDAGTPDYEIWLDGIVIDTVTPESFDFELPGFNVTPPPLEIVEVSDVPDSEIRPPFLILQWREIALATSYSVEFLVGSVFEKQKFVYPKGSGYLRFQTPAQVDATEVIWRIRAMDDAGNFGVEVPFTIDIVKNPDPPDVSITYVVDSVVVGVA